MNWFVEFILEGQVLNWKKSMFFGLMYFQFSIYRISIQKGSLGNQYLPSTTRTKDKYRWIKYPPFDGEETNFNLFTKNNLQIYINLDSTQKKFWNLLGNTQLMTWNVRKY